MDRRSARRPRASSICSARPSLYGVPRTMKLRAASPMIRPASPGWLRSRRPPRRRCPRQGPRHLPQYVPRRRCDASPSKPQVDDFGLVADIDPSGRRSPVVRVDECLAATEEEAVGPGQVQGPAQRRLPPDPVIRHPARKRHRLRHEQLDQRRPGVLRVQHVDVVDEFLGGIWIDHEVVDLEVGDPDVPRVARVAAAHMARCPLDKRDLGACVTRRERRAEAGVPASNDDHASGHAADASPSGFGSTNYRGGLRAVRAPSRRMPNSAALNGPGDSYCTQWPASGITRKTSSGWDARSWISRSVTSASRRRARRRSRSGARPHRAACRPAPSSGRSAGF